MDSAERQALHDVPEAASPAVPEAESRAWNSFYHSGSVEDYIRYAQLRHRRDSGAGSHTAGAQNADQDTGVND